MLGTEGGRDREAHEATMIKERTGELGSLTRSEVAVSSDSSFLLCDACTAGLLESIGIF